MKARHMICCLQKACKSVLSREGKKGNGRKRKRKEDILNRGLYQESPHFLVGTPLVVTVAATQGPGRDVAGRDTGKGGRGHAVNIIIECLPKGCETVEFFVE